MYRAKSEGASKVYSIRVTVSDGELIELGASENLRSRSGHP